MCLTHYTAIPTFFQLKKELIFLVTDKWQIFTDTIKNLKGVIMKDTGIVRRVDELGRVVIPKELRRSLKIRTGEQLEIYTTEKRELVLKKYSQMESQFENVNELCSALSENTGSRVIVCDNANILAVEGLSDNLVGEDISNSLYEKMNERTEISVEKKELRVGKFFTVSNYTYISPILAGGDLYGAIILNKDTNFTEADIEKCRVMTTLISNCLV